MPRADFHQSVVLKEKHKKKIYKNFKMSSYIYMDFYPSNYTSQRH